MKSFPVLLIIAGLIFCTGMWVEAAEQSAPRPSRLVSPATKTPPKITKGTTATPQPFQVKSVQFLEISENNQKFLATAITFNKDVDPASVQQNVNIRLLKKDENHMWRDASTQNNNVRVVQHIITWASGAPLENGYYVMHLRGTLKSKDGLFLDCNKDGKGEGGSLPPFESQIYQVNLAQIEIIDPVKIEELREMIGR